MSERPRAQMYCPKFRGEMCPLVHIQENQKSIIDMETVSRPHARRDGTDSHSSSSVELVQKVKQSTMCERVRVRRETSSSNPNSLRWMSITSPVDADWAPQSGSGSLWERKKDKYPVWALDSSGSLGWSLLSVRPA